MGSSTLKPGGAPAASSVKAGDPAEAKKREAERLRQEQIQIEFAKYMHSKFPVMWRRIDDAPDKDPDPRTPAPAHAAALATMATLTKLLPDGVYVSTSAKYLDEQGQPKFSVKVEGGQATPRPPLTAADYVKDKKKFMKDFKEAYGQIMDMLATGKGFGVVNIDLPSVSNPPTDYDRWRLDTLINMAQEKGLGIQESENIKTLISYMKPQEQADYFAKIQNAKFMHQESTGGKLLAYARLTETIAAREEIKDPATYINSVVGKKEGEDYIAALSGEADKLKERYTALESALARVNDEIQKVTEGKDKPGATAEELDVLGKSMKDLQSNRDKLMTAMESEQGQLKTMHAALEAKKSDPIPPDPKSPLPPTRQAEFGKMMTDKLASVTAVKTKVDAEVPAVKATATARLDALEKDIDAKKSVAPKRSGP